jgi:hypothetical protein
MYLDIKVYLLLLRREVLQPVNHKVELGRRPWSEFLSLLLIATCFRDLGIVWFCPSTRTFTPLRRWSPGIVYLPGGVVVELCFSPSWGCGSSGEIPIFGLPKLAMVTDTPSLEASPWRVSMWLLGWSRLWTRWWTSGLRTREVVLVHRGGGLGNHHGW